MGIYKMTAADLNDPLFDMSDEELLVALEN
jgi:hypothetical protein